MHTSRTHSRITYALKEFKERTVYGGLIAICVLGTLYDSDNLRWAHDELCCGYPIRHRSGPNKALEAHFLEPTGATEDSGEGRVVPWVVPWVVP